MTKSEDDTIAFAQQKSFAEQFFAPPQPQFEMRFGAATHTGLVRQGNEDHYAVARRTRCRETLATSLPADELALPDDEAYGLAVADGIGGYAFGEFASRLALRTMFELANRATSWVMKVTDLDAQNIRQRVEAYIEQIQQTLQAYAREHPQLRNMGTTWTSAHVFSPHAVIVHIGDSRVYLHRQGSLRQLTRDHTMAQDMIDFGVDAGDVAKFTHLLTNSLGAADRRVFADIHHEELQPGDRLLLCTDGLTDMVDDQSISAVLQMPESPQALCDRLVEQALDAGGEDNVTVVLCEVILPEAAGNDDTTIGR